MNRALVFGEGTFFITKKSQTQELVLRGAKLMIKMIKPERIIGGQNKSISSPFLIPHEPSMTVNILSRYLKFEYKNANLLFLYSKLMIHLDEIGKMHPSP